MPEVLIWNGFRSSAEWFIAISGLSLGGIMLQRSLLCSLSIVLLTIAPGAMGWAADLGAPGVRLAQIRRDRGAPERTESHGGQAIPAPPEAGQQPRRDRGAPERTDSLGGQVFTPPDIFVPGDTTRGAEHMEPDPQLCTTNPDAAPQVLAAIDDFGQAYGLTLSAFPALYAYIPPNTATTGVFTLINADLEVVAAIPFEVPTAGGIVALNTADVIAPLAIDEWYEWQITLVCGEEAQQQSELALLMRVEPDATLAEQLQQADAKRLPTLLGQQGLWYDALAASFRYHGQAPDDGDWLPEWQQLLLDGNLDAVLEALDLMPEPDPAPLTIPASPTR